jgi:DNA-binding NtrC family response regulator
MTPVIESVVTLNRALRVLVVEDESRWRDLLLDFIPEMGFKARGARSAEEALEVMKQEPHDILILDLHLPSMNGIELFERVRREWPTTQGIVLTAFGELSVAQQAIRLRIAEFLTKPCHLYEIETALERARQLITTERAAATSPPTPPSQQPSETLDETMKKAIADALERHSNNKSAAARALGISRRSLYDRLR